MMLFKKKFKVVEILKNDVTVVTWLEGKPKDVNKDIEDYQKNAKRYVMVGKEGMVVWA